MPYNFVLFQYFVFARSTSRWLSTTSDFSSANKVDSSYCLLACSCNTPSLW